MADSVVAENIDWQVGLTVLEANSYMFEKQVRCDVFFELLTEKSKTKKKIGAHSYVLASRSPVFEAMFSDRWSKEANIITIEDCTFTVFVEFLRYVYMDKCTYNARNSLPLIYIAGKYMFPSLVEEITTFIPGCIASSNVCTFLQMSSEFGAKDLEERCHDFIMRNAGEVLQNDDSINLSRPDLKGIVESDVLLGGTEEDVFKACLKWGKCQCKTEGVEPSGTNVRARLGDLLYQIRLPTIAPKQLSVLLQGQDVITSAEMGPIFMFAFDKIANPQIKFETMPRAYKSHSICRFTTGAQTQHTIKPKVDAITFSCNTDILLMGTTVQSDQVGSIPSGTLSLSGPDGTYVNRSILAQSEKRGARDTSSRAVPNKIGLFGGLGGQIRIVNSPTGRPLIDIYFPPKWLRKEHDYTLKIQWNEKEVDQHSYLMYIYSQPNPTTVSYQRNVIFTFKNAAVPDNSSNTTTGQFQQLFFHV